MRKKSALPILPSFALKPIRSILHKQEPFSLLTPILLYTAFLGLFHLPCPFRALFHVPCPGCGMTRAWLSVCRLDFSEAFSFHRMFWAVPFFLLYVLYSGAPFRSRLLNRLLLAAFVFGFLLNWFLNIASLY